MLQISSHPLCSQFCFLPKTGSHPVTLTGLELSMQSRWLWIPNPPALSTWKRWGYSTVYLVSIWSLNIHQGLSVCLLLHGFRDQLQGTLLSPTLSQQFGFPSELRHDPMFFPQTTNSLCSPSQIHLPGTGLTKHRCHSGQSPWTWTLMLQCLSMPSGRQDPSGFPYRRPLPGPPNLKLFLLYALHR